MTRKWEVFTWHLLLLDALKLYDSCLSDYEQSEIFDYPQVYFLGNGANKIKGSISNPKNNHGVSIVHPILFRYQTVVA